MIGRLNLKIGCLQKVTCIIGVNSPERVTPQTIKIRIEATADVSKSCESDNLDDTISYGDLGNICEKVAINGKYFLMEKLAYEILKRVHVQYPTISNCNIKIVKYYKGKKYFIKMNG
jgi:dihydroneopterin aldolase